MRDLKVYAAPVVVPEQFRLTKEEEDQLDRDCHASNGSLNASQVLYKAGFLAGQKCVWNEIEEDYCAASDALTTALTMIESFESNMRSVMDHPKTNELERILCKDTLHRFEALYFVLQRLSESMRTLSPAD